MVIIEQLFVSYFLCAFVYNFLKSVSRNLRTKSGLPAGVAQNLWAEHRNHFLQRVITAVTKITNHIRRQDEEKGKEESNEIENKKDPAQLLKRTAREVCLKMCSIVAKILLSIDMQFDLLFHLLYVINQAVKFLMEPTVHPGQNTRALPNPWI